jgi:hypothetical protein
MTKKEYDELGDTLSKMEEEFVVHITKYPGCKTYDIYETVEDGTEYGHMVRLWKKPEALGYIECVGSYKWKPTDKVKLGLVIN